MDFLRVSSSDPIQLVLMDAKPKAVVKYAEIHQLQALWDCGRCVGQPCGPDNKQGSKFVGSLTLRQGKAQIRQ